MQGFTESHSGTSDFGRGVGRGKLTDGCLTGVICFYRRKEECDYLAADCGGSYWLLGEEYDAGRVDYLFIWAEAEGIGMEGKSDEQYND